ncbi:hypothetical protein ACPOL_0547 [Acidisarcina polymorpha]|jgi:hypothetical protein|uniref:Uncharacterized protein n=2 Tax=Acidobacteriaceae TaxID=204434 RepID=A0A2Z5FT84_9BACT|nr:hypothetical protein [Acidisarcina polymorpha]AXC09922.1 hypothetical protein ACPOL_0547 [Acidisarcina polymorpha]
MQTGDMGDDISINSDQKERLASLWREAQDQTISVSNTTPQALFEGVNFRFHLGHAMKAALETAKAVVSFGKAFHSPFEIWSWVECGAEAGAALMSVFESLVQRMSAIQYVTAVVLSEHIPAGIKPNALEAKVKDFLNDPKSHEYAWHLGMSKGRLSEAKEAIGDEDWFVLSLAKLRDLGFIFDEPVSGKLMFKSINFVVGVKSETGG